MADNRYKTALELIAGLAPDSRFFWTDRGGRLREHMSAADLARAVLSDLVQLETIGQDRRSEGR